MVDDRCQIGLVQACWLQLLHSTLYCCNPVDYRPLGYFFREELFSAVGKSVFQLLIGGRGVIYSLEHRRNFHLVREHLSEAGDQIIGNSDPEIMG